MGAAISLWWGERRGQVFSAIINNIAHGHRRYQALPDPKSGKDPWSTHLWHRFNLDYCNTLLCGVSACSIPEEVAASLEYLAARILTGTRKREYITPVLFDIHWLSVEPRVQYKILLLTYNYKTLRLCLIFSFLILSYPLFSSLV